MENYLFPLIMVIGFGFTCSAQNNQINLHVDANSVIYTLKGGIGASWHAMVNEIPLENEKYDYPVRFINPRGSAYAGNPPLTDTAAWRQLYHHASWLGLNFIRVEISQRMYEPDKEKFDWDNEEMQVLYKILDWCEANHADVFLQQMWRHVEWNAYPGVHPLLSAPANLDDFANGIAALLENLTKTKKYSCIKYFCITNEPPGGPWGYWWSYGSGSGSITPALKKVQETLQAKNINIPLSGPDWTSLPPFDASKIDFDEYLGAYDIHSYDGISEEGELLLSDWVQWAHHKQKPMFISEFGNMNMGWGGSNPGPKSFAASLSNASDVIHGLNLFVDGFNRWSFVNRGDMDGQWQLVKTYDIENKRYLTDIEPENAAYYGFAALTRFMGKYTQMLQWETDYCIRDVKPTAFKNKDGNIVLLFINKKNNPVNVNLSLTGIKANTPLQFYQLTADKVNSPDFRFDPQKSVKGWSRKQTIELLPQSITVLTTYNLKQDDLGIIE